MIRTEQIFFRVGAFQLHGLSLDIASGQYFVLLGPPGSGKSVLLECLCGLKRVDSGRIFIDGRDVTFLEPRARKVGYVPQDYALFPHLTVEQNITFGLRVRRCKREDVIRRVSRTADLLGIEHLLSRRIGGLSGGEAQRVALARAVVLQPRVLLLDEPVCALDEATRQEVCSEVFRVQRHLGLTVVHVSHNLEEAFSVADQAAILRQGVLEQVGALADLIRRPNSKFVARFLRSENVFSGRAVGPGLGQQRTRVRVGDVELQVPGEHQGEVTLVIRPEGVLIRPCSNGCRKGENEIHVRLARWRSYGSYIRVELDGTFALVAHLTEAAFDEMKIEHQTTLLAVLSPENIHVLPQ